MTQTIQNYGKGPDVRFYDVAVLTSGMYEKLRALLSSTLGHEAVEVLGIAHEEVLEREGYTSPAPRSPPYKSENFNVVADVELIGNLEQRLRSKGVHIAEGSEANSGLYVSVTYTHAEKPEIALLTSLDEYGVGLSHNRLTDILNGKYTQTINRKGDGRSWDTCDGNSL